MSDLPSITGKQAIEVFASAGFEVVRRSKSSHHIMKKAGHAFLLSVPVHAHKNLKPGTLRGLIRASGLSVEEFVSMLQN